MPQPNPELTKPKNILTPKWDWSNENLKEGVSDEKLFNTVVGEYAITPADKREEFIGGIGETLKTKYHWSEESLAAFRTDIIAGAEAQTELRSGARPEAYPSGSFTLNPDTPLGVAYTDLDNSSITWQEAYNKMKTNLKTTKKEIQRRRDAGLSLHLSNDPSDYKDLEARREDEEGSLISMKNRYLQQLAPIVVDGERLDYIWGTEEADKRFVVYRRAMQTLVAADNEDLDVRYDESGMFLKPKGSSDDNYERVSAPFYKYLIGNAMDSTFIGAEVALASIWAGSKTASQAAEALGRVGNNRFVRGFGKIFARAGPAVLLTAGMSVAADNYQQRRIAEELNLAADSDYDDFILQDDIGMNLVSGAVSQGLGTVAGRGYIGAVKLAKSLNPNRIVPDEVIDIFAAATQRPREELVKSAREYFAAYKGRGGTIRLPKRPRFLGLFGRMKSEEQALKPTNLKELKLHEIPDADLVYNYILNTDPIGVQLTKSMFRDYPDIQANMLLNGAANRARALKEELGGDMSYDDYGNVTAELGGYLKGLDKHKQRILDEYKNPIDWTEENIDLFNKLAPELKDSVTKSRAEGDLNVGELMGLVYRFKQNNKLTIAQSNQIDKFAGKFMGDEENTELLQKILMKESLLESIDVENTVKALDSTNISLEEVLTLLHRSNTHAGGPKYYNGILKGVSDKNKDMVEAGIINMFRQRHTQITPKQYGEIEVTDWVGLAKDLERYKPYTDTGRDYKLLINTFAKDHRADPMFSDAFKPKVNLNVDSEPSIAMSPIGKAKVKLSSQIFQLANSYLGHHDNRFKRARLLVSAGLNTFTNDPFNDASYKNLIQAATIRARQISKEEAKQRAAAEAKRETAESTFQGVEL